VLAPIDLLFRGRREAIGVYIVDTDSGPALLDTGPASTRAALEAGLAEHGTTLDELRHVLLSHVHLDHAGAVGVIVRDHPHLTVWVSEVGARHLVDPSRLERSARRLFGEAFDELWGELAPVPEANVRIPTGSVLGWEAFPTVGHASHHLSYASGGAVLAGDATGMRLPGSRFVLPAAPPPDIDVDAWHATVDAIRARCPDRLAATHFGVYADVDAHLERLDQELDVWASRVRDGLSEAAFVEAARVDAAVRVDDYDAVAPFAASWHGLRRYWGYSIGGMRDSNSAGIPERLLSCENASAWLPGRAFSLCGR
jgi:glyoxylase-like metal-dependent hydrolase (beta-lactamase superfamily II)